MRPSLLTPLPDGEGRASVHLEVSREAAALIGQGRQGRADTWIVTISAERLARFVLSAFEGETASDVIVSLMSRKH